MVNHKRIVGPIFMKEVIVATSLDSERLLSCVPIKWRTKNIYWTL